MQIVYLCCKTLRKICEWCQKFIYYTVTVWRMLTELSSGQRGCPMNINHNNGQTLHIKKMVMFPIGGSTP